MSYKRSGSQFILVIICFLSSCNKDDEIYESNYLKDPFVGYYDCDVTYKSTYQDSNGTWITNTNEYRDTIEIIRCQDTGLIEIIGGPNSIADLNYSDSTFNAYHLYGKFFKDSVYIYYYWTPVALYNWEYMGKRI